MYVIGSSPQKNKNPRFNYHSCLVRMSARLSVLESQWGSPAEEQLGKSEWSQISVIRSRVHVSAITDYIWGIVVNLGVYVELRIRPMVTGCGG
jgi:hypothetical protein